MPNQKMIFNFDKAKFSYPTQIYDWIWANIGKDVTVTPQIHSDKNYVFAIEGNNIQSKHRKAIKALEMERNLAKLKK